MSRGSICDTIALSQKGPQFWVVEVVLVIEKQKKYLKLNNVSMFRIGEFAIYVRGNVTQSNSFCSRTDTSRMRM